MTSLQFLYKGSKKSIWHRNYFSKNGIILYYSSTTFISIKINYWHVLIKEQQKCPFNKSVSEA